MAVHESIERMKHELKAEGIIPEQGLGKELFLFASTLTPIVNVDLVVLNERHQILLSWRDDPYCGRGWHIPGGCIRLRETFEERIQKTAQLEIGAHVEYERTPLAVYEILSPQYRPNIADQRERSHFITIAFECYLTDEILADDEVLEPKNGSLRWFDDLPDNLLEVQNCYRNTWYQLTQRWRKEI